MLDDSGRPFLAKWRRPAHLAASVCLAVTITATLAWAAFHTRLESSVPAADEVLTVAPERFELRFSGPVNEALSSLVLLLPSEDSVRVALQTPGDDRILVGDIPDLVDGEYLVRWRTVSADGHAVSGEFRFTFKGSRAAGDSGEARSATVDRLPAARAASRPDGEKAADDPTAAASGEETPPPGSVVIAGLGLACLLGFAGLLWFCGSSPLLQEPRIRLAILSLGWGALVLLTGELIRWLMGIIPPEAGFAGFGAALGSRTGAVGIARIGLVAIALGVLRGHGRAAAALAVTAAVIGAASGHSAAIAPWITMPAKAVHLGAVSIWLGGLLLLILAPDGPTDGSEAWHFGSVARAVSAAALLSVVLVAASGMVQSARFVGDFAAYTGTTYGRGVLVKWTGLAVLVGFGAFHRFRVMPKLERDGDGSRLRRTVRLETIVMLAVVMLAAWLARVSPPGGR